MIAGTAAGIYPTLADASKRLIQLDEEIVPNPDWVPGYEKLGELFDQIYEDAGTYYEKLDQYAALNERQRTPMNTSERQRR
jgi:Sugar (pentulose and hexulose) kinases